MATLDDLFDLVRRSGVSEPKRDGYDFTVEEIEEGLSNQGLGVDRSTLYKQFKGLEIKKNARGYFSAPDVVVLIGWNERKGDFSKYPEYLELVGRQLRAIAEQKFEANKPRHPYFE